MFQVHLNTRTASFVWLTETVSTSVSLLLVSTYYDWHEKDLILFNAVMICEDYVVLLVGERNMMLTIGEITSVSHRVF